MRQHQATKSFKTAILHHLLVFTGQPHTHLLSIQNWRYICIISRHIGKWL